MNLRSASYPGAIAFIFLFIASCTTKMTIEEAKKVTIATSKKTFVMPPRNSMDINVLLDKKGIYTSQSTAEYTRKAAMPPPSGADDATLKQFYEDRGIAAYQLGNYKIALEDLRKAYGYLQNTGGKRNVLAINLSFLEFEVGNFNKSIDILEEEIHKNPFPWTMYSFLTHVYVRLGDMESARDMNRRCRETCSDYRRRYPGNTGDIEACEAQLNRSEGFLFEGEGKFDKAVESFRKFADYSALRMNSYPRHAIAPRLHLINNLTYQGKLFEAEFEARKGLQQSLDLTGKNSVLTGDMLALFVKILRQQDRLQEADNLSKETIKIFEASGVGTDSYIIGFARAMRGDILFAQDNYAEAMKVYDKAMIDFKDNQQACDAWILRNMNMVVSLIKTGRAEEAAKMASNAYESNRKIYGGESDKVAEALGIRAMANVKLGRNEEAHHDFSLALPTLRKSNLDQIPDSDNRKRVAVIYESYIDFLSQIRGTDLEEKYKIKADLESYKIMNALSGYSLSVAMGKSSARAAASYDGDLADLVRREQDALKEINILEKTISVLLSTTSDEVTAKGINESITRINNLEKARVIVLDEIEKRFPRYADYLNPKQPTVEVTQKNLRQGEAFVSIYTTDEKTYVWCIPKSGDVKFAVSPLGKKELADIVFNLRRALDSHSNVLGDIPDYDVSSAYSLYKKIFEPVESGFKGATDLLVVVRGPLGQLPLATLPAAPASPLSDRNVLFDRYRNVPWLIRNVSVTVLPSVSTFVTLRGLPPSDPNRKAFAGFGDPIFSKDQAANLDAGKKEKSTILASRGTRLQVRGVRICEEGNIDNKQINSIKLEDLNRLPDTAGEITDTANALHADLAQDVYLGKNASERKLKTMTLSDRRVISFATHALIPGDLDGLDQPALALSSPSVTGDSEDGLLTMGEIMKLKLNADWVVLSACNTGASEGGGTEALTGLGRAFFYAGTRSILASMWPVETTSARKLVTGIFEAQKTDASLSRSQALRKSMLDLIDIERFFDPATGKIAASYAHPLFWAPFTIVGESGKR